MKSQLAVMTLGAAALQLGVRTWQIRRLFERGLLPPAQRIGAYRVIPPEDIPKVEEALREAGYLTAEREAGHAD